MVKDTVNTRDTAIKKQRKKTNSTTEANKPEEDAYKKIVDFEESEAFKRSPDKDAELYFQTCKSIRQLFREIADLKQLATPEAQEKISEKRVETCMLITVLKKLNRLEKFRTKSGRDALHQEKLRTDSTKLQLQNLLYELSYLKKEIAKCFQFRSLDEEIDLVPAEQFFEEAPATVSRPGTTKGDQHQLQLARLEWELQQRKQLATQCRKLETEKSQVAEEILKKQERLAKLAPQLNDILEATKPLQEHLGITSDRVREEHQLAYLLPNPLYLLYAKVDAYTQVYDKSTKVHILGEEEEARQLKKDDVESIESIADSDSDQDAELSEEQLERQKRHHRKSSRVTEPKEAKRCKLLASHPLYVQIEIHLGKDKGPCLVLDFQYKLKLNVVTVKCKVNMPEAITGISTGEVLSPENILRELFPNDNGEESPNPTNHYQLQQLGLGSVSSILEQLGYPYRWAQRICGLDFIASKVGGAPPTANSELSQTSVESVMKVLSRRFRSRISLAKQIQDLERNEIPEFGNAEYLVPSRTISSICEWRRISWHEYNACASASALTSASTSAPVSASVSTSALMVSHTDMLYRCTLRRDAATLVALLAVKNNFPLERSIITVTVNHNGTYDSANCDAIRDIERAVNTDWPTETNNSTWLLGAQLRRLAACFDIYLEITSPEEFPREKIYFQQNRGRNRRQPFKFLKVGGGIYTQY